MLSYFLGIPGSGKTYYGVNVIYDNFAKDIPKKTKLSFKKDYKYCYTNINELNYSLLKNVKKFDYDDIIKKLTVLFNMYKKDKATDKELIFKAKEFKLYKCLFVLDEAHNYFSNVNEVLVWWLTYHRHLYHDIFLITQNLSLINSKYKPLAEAFYKAKSSSLTLNKNYFNYMYYTESRMTKASYVNTIKIKKNQEVFKLYKSGDSIESKNVIMRFIYISLFFLLALFVLAFYFYYKASDDNLPLKSSSEKSLKQEKDNSKFSSEIISSSDYSSSVYMKFICDDEMCSYHDMYFDIKLLSFAREKFNLEIINSRRVFSQAIVSVVVDSSFRSFIGVSQNENVSQDITSNINPFSNNK